MGIRSRYETLERYKIALHVNLIKRDNKVSDYILVCNRCKKRFSVDKKYGFDTAVGFLVNALQKHKCKRGTLQDDL